MNNLKKYIYRIIAFSLLVNVIGIFASKEIAAQQRFPVTANTLVSKPYSVYLSDYFDATAEKLQVRLLFNDFNEPSIDVRIRITVESSGLRLQTRPDALGQPISMTAGVPVTLSGEDLEPYLNYNNLTISGTTVQALTTNNGKLKEGIYTFCVEVLDYKSGVVISNQSCQTAWLVLNDEPTLITPICGNMLKPSEQQNIMFQWQLSNNLSPNAAGVGFEYQLSMYEVTDLAVNPLYAINNGKALLVFESGFLNQTQFLYGMSEPQLDAGKKYVYRVQAKSADGKDVFKNQGFSQICWFSYGSPTDGTIALQSPKNKAVFKDKEEPYFQWNNPTNAVTGQQVSYRMRIVKLSDKQDPKVALEVNEVWHEENTPQAPASRGWDLILKKNPEKTVEYAWQVVAMSNNTEIAKSDIRTFKGANLIDKFNAGSHIVMVKSLLNSDLTKLSGKGEVKIKESGEMLELDFKDLKIIDVAGRYVLDAGEISKDWKNREWIELSPTQKENKSAWFVPQTLKLDKKELAVLGFVRWAFPHATISGKADSVRSVLTSINYDAYTIKAANAILDEKSNDFSLVEPLGFRMKLLKTSDFFIKDNAFTLRLNGEVYLPEKVKGYEKNSERIMFSFTQVNQLFYLKVENLALANNIHILKGTKTVLSPQTVILDFSEKESPLKLATNKSWKGAYFEKFKVSYEQGIDNSNQLYMNDKQTFDLLLKDGDNVKSWVTAQGLNFAYSLTLKEKNNVWFNQFGGRLLSFNINIENNSISQSHFKGDIKIPFISVTDNYAFTMPLSDNGFQIGALDESLESKAFTFNAKNEEQAVDIVIKRAVFTDKERLDMMIDANWKFLKVDIKGLNNFKIWGNGNIGFNKVGGTQTLTQQVKGKLSANPIVINAIAATFSNQQYAFAVKGEVVISDDVSGKNGAPEILLSSALKSGAAAYSPPPSNGSAKNPTATAAASQTTTSKEINFNNLFDRKRQDDGKIVLDSTFIKVNVVLAKFEGMVKMTRNHPDWGDSFQGMFFGEIYLPTPFRMNIIYVSGNVDDKNFWFIQAGVGVGGEGVGKTKKKVKMGKVAKLLQGIPIPPVILTGIDFRLYRHMSHSKEGTVSIDGVADFDFVPDMKTKYGGYMRLTMIDQATVGIMLELSLGVEVAIQDNGFNLGLEGEAKFVNDPFGKSGIIGTGKLTYNSPKKHWVGSFGVVTRKIRGKDFCMEGELSFDASPEKWKVSIGSKEKRFKITPSCVGWGGQGWLQIDPKEFELGLGLSYTAKAESRWIDVKLFKVQPFAKLEIAAGLLGKVAYKPDWVLKEMGLWADLNVAIGAKYESLGSSGEWKLATARLSGEAIVIFEPTPKRMTGKLDGNVEILGIGTDFSLSFSTPLD